MTGQTLEAYEVNVHQIEHKLDKRYTAAITADGNLEPMALFESKDLAGLMAKVEMVLTHHTKGR